ncbi:hypothetical protein QE152_g13802 [Popillia japonica]|uniref:Uncharacterized protein n=1 Tax=Popillia japonica TaxID=7064 RepID=A0AAW1LAQ9_POPJA
MHVGCSTLHLQSQFIVITRCIVCYCFIKVPGRFNRKYGGIVGKLLLEFLWYKSYITKNYSRPQLHGILRSKKLNADCSICLIRNGRRRF